MASKNSTSLKYIYTITLFGVILFGAPTLLFADIKTTSQGCLVSAKLLKNDKNILFIDVRKKAFFEKKNIVGSINIPLNLIRTKAFLKDKSLILVGNGWNESSLIETCRYLKDNGFKSVKVLSGGVIAWFKNKSKVNARALVTVPSEDFFNNNVEKKFVPFVVSDKGKEEIQATLPHAKIYSLKVTQKRLLQDMKQLGAGNNPIVLFSENNPVVDAALTDYLHESKRNVFYFEGGFDTYQKVNNLNKMTALSNKSKRLSTKKPVSCAN